MALLSGLGEPFHEFRELIKDLRFRNAQERQAGELELIGRRMDLAERFSRLSADERNVLGRLQTVSSPNRTSRQAVLPTSSSRGERDG